MKIANIIFLITLFLISGCNRNAETEKITMEWENLIEDAGMSGWEKQGAIETNIENSILILSAQKAGGMLLYNKEFEDFILETEFLIQPENSAGIVFRYNAEKKGDPAYSGYMVNLDHNLEQQNPTGSIFNVSRAKWLKSTKTTDWNKLSIKAQGDHLVVMVNDTLVTETHNRRSENGLLGLMANPSSTVQYKNVRIKELEEQEYLGPMIEDYMRSYAKTPLKPMITENNLDSWRQVGEASWDIDDGVIHGYSNEKGGFLVHENMYHNFYLKLQFKIRHEDNSGIFIRHAPGEANQITTDNAIECNIYDHDGYVHEYSTGSIAPIARSWTKMIDYNDWNDMEIFAFEDHICMYVNGIKSSEAHLPEKFNKKGEVCIQGGIQVFNGNLPSDIYIKEMYIKDFDGVPFLGY